MDTTLLSMFADEPPTRPEGLGITAHELADKMGWSVTVARSALAKKVQSGELVITEMRGNGAGSHKSIYHRPDEWPPKE